MELFILAGLLIVVLVSQMTPKNIDTLVQVVLIILIVASIANAILVPGNGVSIFFVNAIGFFFVYGVAYMAFDVRPD